MGWYLSDEHAGSSRLTSQADSIKEFQISRSTFDVSTGLTGSGAVNIVTKSGSNEVHGSGILVMARRYICRPHRAGAYRVRTASKSALMSVGLSSGIACSGS